MRTHMMTWRRSSILPTEYKYGGDEYEDGCIEYGAGERSAHGGAVYIFRSPDYCNANADTDWTGERRMVVAFLWPASLLESCTEAEFSPSKLQRQEFTAST